MSIKIYVKSGSVQVIDTRGNNVYILEEGIGELTASSSVPAFLEGTIERDQQAAFLKGKADTQDSQIAYLAGGQDVTTATPAYIEGAPTATTSQTAYLHGETSSLDQTSAYLKGKDTSSSSLTAYIEGVVRGSTPAFMEGTEPLTAQSSISAYMLSDGFWPFTDDFTGANDAPWDQLKWVTEKHDE